MRKKLLALAILMTGSMVTSAVAQELCPTTDAPREYRLQVGPGGTALCFWEGGGCVVHSA